MLILALAIIFLSCQRGPECVMKVGSQQLTLDQVLPIVKKNSTLKRGLVNEQTVMDYMQGLFGRDFYYLEEAKNMGLSEIDSINNKVLEHKKKILTRIQGPLYSLVVKEIQKPTADQLKDLYDKRLTQYKLAHILLPSKTLADSVYKLLQMGENFVKLVEKYSFDKRWGDEKGEWKDWFLYGTMGGDFDDKIVSAQPLRAVGPIHTVYGYQIIIVLKKKDRPEKPFSRVTTWLENIYMSMERKREFFNYQNSLPKTFNFKVNNNAAELISGIYTEVDNLPFLNSKALLPEQSKVELATFTGGSLTVEEFIHYYNSQRPIYLPPLNRIDAVVEYCKTACMTDLVFLDACEKGLDKDETYQATVRKFKINILRSEVKKRMYQPFDITEEEKRQRYEADSTFQIQEYDFAENWIERVIRTDKTANEESRQLAILAEKYPLKFCEKGVSLLVKALLQN
jgi:parvulin-like peptidyl-prolyl isomerase